MLSYVTTSIFDSPAQTLVNTVNTVGVMGKGIAAEFKRRYPDMYRRYREVCAAGQLDVGKLLLHPSPHKWVLNFPTKKDWRKPSRVEWIESGLQKFVSTYTDRRITSISFPMLGCGNGGLQWGVVQPVMERYLKTLPIPVFVHLASAESDRVPEHRSPSAVAADIEVRETVTFSGSGSCVRTGKRTFVSPRNLSSRRVRRSSCLSPLSRTGSRLRPTPTRVFRALSSCDSGLRPTPCRDAPGTWNEP